MHKVKKILITGATSGVGFALAKRLLKEGHEVWAIGRNEVALEELAQRGAETFRVDLAQPASFDLLCTEIETPDVVIFSAGVGTFSYAYEATDREIIETMQVNVMSAMQLTRRLLPRMMEKNNGQLIYIGSQAGKVATPKASVYAASKHALIGYTNALRLELKDFHIAVTAIHPGPIDTPFLDSADQTGNYRQSVDKHLLSIQEVVEAVIQTMYKPVREVNLPRYMGLSSKLYGLMPTIVEKLGKRFFFKK